jgi:hypothetical protein
MPRSFFDQKNLFQELFSKEFKKTKSRGFLPKERMRKRTSTFQRLLAFSNKCVFINVVTRSHINKCHANESSREYSNRERNKSS